jgi:eukaryotic-like serine/threonine-protein kinase
MTSEQWARVERLYHEAGEQPHEARREWLARECGDDDLVRREVESLLAQNASSDDLFVGSALSQISGSGNGDATLIGQRIGSYEIAALVDEGGMGQVYRARDLTLPRDVAVKVIPPALAHDPARRARFRQEAELLASLSHPHIAHVYAFVEDGERTLLVMELVGGRTLAERIALGPMPLAEALPVARQIADALDAAHEHGVVHRDLKPANVKITPDGAVKVLDFGLAAPRRPVNGGSPREPDSLSGTAAYLSPERTRGESEDRRGDIWAFGCVLFEMLTGRQAFSGTTVAEILSAILEREPEWSALPSSIPEGVRTLLRRCLDKNPRRRLRDIGEARVLLDDLIAAPSAVSTRWRGAGRIAAAALALVAVGSAAWFAGSRGTPVGTTGTTRLFVGPAPADTLPARPTRTDVALSPDGRTLVFSGLKAGRQQLYARAMNRLEATPIPGTENSNSPFFSPDGQWLAFWQGPFINGAVGELRRVRLDGGAPVTIARTPLLFGATWGPDDTIVFANARGGLRRVPAAGGTPETLTEPEASKNEGSHRLPHFLPDGRSILFTITVGQSARSFEGARIVVRSLVDNRQETVVTGGVDGRYVPSGHLVYARENRLMAVPFDHESLRVTGSAIVVADGVVQAHGPWVPGGVTAGETGAAQFSVSASGSLVFVPGASFPETKRSLVWVDRRGVETVLPAPQHSYLGPRMSPDGRRFVVYAIGFNPAMWIYDLANKTFTPTTPESDGFWPIWSIDDTRITFGREFPTRHMVTMRLDGTGTDWMMKGEGDVPGAWSPDGSTLAFARLLPSSGWEMREWSQARGDRRLLPAVSTPSLERYPTFSPNGRWLAYASDDAGRDQVYVRPYPGPGQRHQISTDGGYAPVWSGDGREFYFMSGRNEDSQLMVVGFDPETGVVSGQPKVLFRGPYGICSPMRCYDPSPDGQHFIMLKFPPLGSDDPVNTQMAVVLNWFEELKRLAPASAQR